MYFHNKTWYTRTRTGGGGNFHYKGIYRCAAGNGVYFSGLPVYEWVSFLHQKYINGVSFSPKKYMNG